MFVQSDISLLIRKLIVHSMKILMVNIIRKLNDIRIPDILNEGAPAVAAVVPAVPCPPGPGVSEGGTGSPGLITQIA